MRVCQSKLSSSESVGTGRVKTKTVVGYGATGIHTEYSTLSDIGQLDAFIATMVGFSVQQYSCVVRLI